LLAAGDTFDAQSWAGRSIKTACFDLHVYESEVMSLKPEAVGQRFRDLSVSFPNADWIVDKIFKGTDGLEYAAIRSATDHTRRKTLAVSVITDASRFAPVE
jgi:hypothetical protein